MVGKEEVSSLSFQVNTIKIAITGSESTGKTTLVKSLAKYFSGLYLEEYAREYIANLTRPYILEDILKIAQIQKKREENILRQNPNFFFSDTELLVTKVWSKNAFDKVPQWIESQLQKQDYDLYLLTNIDLDWEYDPQREHPKENQRLFFFNWYQEELEKYNFPYKIISGQGKRRFQNAINVIKEKFINIDS